MDTTQALRNANATLIIRQHLSSFPLQFGADNATKDLTIWALGQGYTLEEVAYLLNVQAFELISADDMNATIADDLVDTILYDFRDEDLYLVRIAR